MARPRDDDRDPPLRLLPARLVPRSGEQEHQAVDALAGLLAGFLAPRDARYDPTTNAGAGSVADRAADSEPTQEDMTQLVMFNYSGDVTETSAESARRSTRPKGDRLRLLDADPVGELEIGRRLGERPQTVAQWHFRVHLPPPRWTVSGRPAWHWPDVEQWARETGRLGARPAKRTAKTTSTADGRQRGTRR